MCDNRETGFCSNNSDSAKESYADLLQRAIKAEKCCNRIQARFDESQRIANLGSWEFDIKSKYLSWSKETYRIFGLEPGPEDKDNFAVFIKAVNSEDLSMINKAVINTLQHRTLYSLDYRISRIDNQQERILHAHAEIVRDPDTGQPLKMVGTIMDVTARRLALQKLELLQSAVDHSSETIVITDHKANIIYTNPAFTTITGYSQQEAMGLNPRILQSGQTKPEVFSQMWQTLVSKRSWRGHFLNQKKDGSLYEEEVSISPLLDHEKKITHYIAVKRDISSEVLLRRRLQEAQKMEAIGTLAGGIAHDFNNILTILVGNLELAMMFELEENHPAQKGLGKALDAGQRAKELVGQILTFSRQQTDEFKPLKSTPIIKEAVKLIRKSLPATINLQFTSNVRQDIIMAAPSPLHQIIVNLCSNASDAMRDQGGELEIYAANMELDESSACQYDNLKAGTYLVLKVSDTGLGISQENADKIFEPYFTTKPTGQGSGLGLSTVHGIVKKLNGEISMVSTIGKGSTFTVLLPTLDFHENITESVSDMLMLPTGSEQILMVDDENEIIELNQTALEKLGYRVSTCSDGISALKMVEHNPHFFDLVITDMTMPKLTGDRLAREILKLVPEMPIILGTGYSDSINREEALALGVKAFYNKPLSTSRLLRLVRKVLDESQDKR